MKKFKLHEKSRLSLGSILGFLVYSATMYVFLIPLQLWVESIGIALVLGFFLWFINELNTHLRRLNGEKFPGYDKDYKKDEPDEMIKS